MRGTTWLKAATLLTACALATSIPTRALAGADDSDESDDADDSDDESSPPKKPHKKASKKKKASRPWHPLWELGLTGGLVFPTEMTPKEVFPTHTGVGPFIRFDMTRVWTELLAMGSYISYSSHPVKQIDGYEAYGGLGSIPVFSAGGTLKFRFELSPEAVFRLGASVGVNYSRPFISLNGGTATTSMTALGFGLGATAELRYALGDNGGVLFQLGFLSQPTGSASFPNDTARAGEAVSFAFAPTFFVAVGPELFF